MFQKELNLVSGGGAEKQPTGLWVEFRREPLEFVEPTPSKKGHQAPRRPEILGQRPVGERTRAAFSVSW